MNGGREESGCVCTDSAEGSGAAQGKRSAELRQAVSRARGGGAAEAVLASYRGIPLSVPKTVYAERARVIPLQQKQRGGGGCFLLFLSSNFLVLS